MKKLQQRKLRRNKTKNRPVERRGDFCYNGGIMASKKGVGSWRLSVVAWKNSAQERGRKLWKTYGTPKNLTIAGIGIVCLVAIIIGSMVYQQSRPSSTATIPATLASVIRHPLTGARISSELAELPQVFGVMIENSADAWPLSGVDGAFLVFEAPVEGNIPRFLAFYSEDQSVAKIGPVRSARDYFLDWNGEFDSIYAHVGGSPQALERIREDGIMDLDQFFQSEYFYRNELTRYAPHNVYTTTDDLVNAIAEIDEKYEHDVPTYDVWRFTDGTSENESSSIIHLDWSNSSGYNVDWVYEPSTNTYGRKQGGNAYTANNVVVLETSVDVIAGDDKGRKELITIGTGEMHLFQNGIEIIGAWKKPSVEERLRFYDDEGNEIIMNAGTTWIEVIDTLDRLSVSEPTTGPTR